MTKFLIVHDGSAIEYETDDATVKVYPHYSGRDDWADAIEVPKFLDMIELLWPHLASHGYELDLKGKAGE